MYDILISGITGKQEKKIYVSFTEGENTAEGILPDCVVISNKGFDDEELEKIEKYMRENRDLLVNQAKTVNPMRAFLGMDSE